MLPNNKSIFRKLLKNLDEIVKAGIEPIELIRSVLWVWAKKVTPNLDISIKPDSSLIELSPVRLFSEWLEQSEILISAFWLSSAYSLLISEKNRKNRAMYFTPPELSNRMVRNAGDILYTGKVIDPACGGAAFLAPAAKNISEYLSSQGLSSEDIIDHIEKNLFGVDVDDFLCELSSVFLLMVLSEHIYKAGRYPKLNLVCGDGLSAFTTNVGTFDVVLSNPPYRKLTRDEVLPLLPKYKNIILGQPNIYAIFIQHSANLLKPGGKAALLTPMSFLSGRYFSSLRKSLVMSGKLHQLDLIHDKQGVFLGAEQDAVLTLWEKGAKQDKPAYVNSISLAGEIEENGLLTLSSTDAPWAVPKNSTDNELLGLFAWKRHNLSSYGFQVKIGSIVIHRDTRKRFKEHKDVRSMSTLRPLIWQHDIGTNGKLMFDEVSEAEDRYIDIIDPESPVIVKRPSVALQRVTSSDQSRRLICAPVPLELIEKYNGIVGENHVCFIEHVVKEPEIDHILLSEVLRTNVMDRLFRCISGSTNVSSYELNNLPFPDPAILKVEIGKGTCIENAVRVGFGLELINL